MLNWKAKHNRLKDILINHVYDYGYNQVVQKIEGEGFSLTYEDPTIPKGDFEKHLIENALKTGPLKAYYSTRDKEYCKVIEEDGVLHKELINKLLDSKFQKSNSLFRRVKKAHDELITESYLSRNNPIQNEVRLTPKGKKHYIDGLSFERVYRTRRIASIALWLSGISIIIAIASAYYKN